MANKTMEEVTANDSPQKSELNEREKSLLVIALLRCLKSGPPDIDMAKFVEHGGFNTVKTAQNTWGKIKAKLAAALPATAADENGSELPPATPKGKVTPRKRKAAVFDSDDGDDTKSTPTPVHKKVARSKRSAGADLVKGEADDDIKVEH